MKHKYAIFIRFINILFDLFVLNVVIFFITFKYQNLIDAFVVVLWVNIVWVISSFFAKLYLYKNLIYFREGLISFVKALFFFIVINIVIDFFLLNSFFLTKVDFLKLFFLLVLILAIARIFFYILKKYYSLEFYWSNNVVTIGDMKVANLLKKQFLEKKELGYKHINHLSEADVHNTDTNELIEFFKQSSIEEVFFINCKLEHNIFYNFIKLLEHNSIRVKFVPDFQDFYTKPNNLVLIGDYPVLYLRKEPLESLFNRMIKRLFDIFFSIIVIALVFSWLFPIIAFLIKIESKGPIFFKQKRSGRDNLPFWCFKFRSMRKNDIADSTSAVKGDPRVTFWGSILRKTSIDELPQFFNVLLGNMSIVGPRPHMINHTSQYSTSVDKYMVRHFVKPGITGWAQVNGYRGEIQTISDIEGRVEKDIWYIENWSITLDLHIILLTVYNIFRGEEKAY